MDRWKLLNPREKELIWRYVVLEEKRYAVACKLHMSTSMVGQILTPVFRIIGVHDSVGLALFIGKHYEQIELDAVALGLEMPKESTVAK